MRLDYLTIFPGYLAPLELSLPGRAVASGLLELHVHDLRRWTHDRRRTVDDTPYGGGAGMVMRPEPWGEAFDELGIEGATVVVPTPSGRPLTQALARELATRERLVFCCGRYEGIDQRVVEHAASRTEVLEVSLGDYVLNGGEAAALVVTEAVVRLLPGFMGNAASLEEESHEAGLLEYPGYTKPATWRGLEVPPVLLSGDHGRIAAWRHEQALTRTAERRPDLLHASAAPGEWAIEPATRADAGELLTLQLACWVTEAQVNDDLGIPALHETLDDVLVALEEHRTWVVRRGGRLVGSVRGRLLPEEPDRPGEPDQPPTWQVGRLMVAPDLRGQGLGRALLDHVLAAAPPGTRLVELFTGKRSERNLRMYRRAGFRPVRTLEGRSGPVVLHKRISGA